MLSFSVDRKLISERNVQLVKDKKQLKDELSAKNSKGLIVKQNELSTKLKEHQDTLEEPYKIYQAYLDRVKRWEEDRNEIIGNEQTQGTLKYFKNKIKLLDDLPSSFQKLNDQRIEKAGKIFCKLIEIKEIYKNSYSPVQEFIEENQDESDKLDLTFDVKIECEGFTDKFFKMVNRGKTGTYYEERGEIRLTEEIKPIDWSNWNSVSSFLRNTTNNLLFDNRKKPKKINQTSKQLRQGYTSIDIYNYIFGLEYLTPVYGLQLDGKSIPQLSPGERGLLLLIFYLLIDKANTPLIIDQPEANLDNETVVRKLNPYIREAKKRRQLIIVTHNPNLAVVCDAEQVIVAKMDKQHGNEITYESGALEEMEINKDVVNVLEGTQPAFKKRQSKYYFD